MAVPISNVPRRQVYAPSGAGGAGPYAFTFEILSNTDIAVYKDDTLLTLTTHYTVTINVNGTGSVTITGTGLALAPTSPTQYAIVGNRTISRTTDFTTGGDFFANVLNDELDQQTIFSQQNAEGVARALQAPQTDPTSINMVMPRSTVRANKVLSFDSSGNPVSLDFIGSNRGNWATATVYYVRDIVKDTSNSNIYQVITQHTSSGSQPISSNVDVAKWALLVDAAAAGASASAAASSASAASTWATLASISASAASGSAINASTSASSASTSATNAASSASAASTSATNAAASYDSFDDRYLGPKASPPTLDNDGNALLTGALYFDTVLSSLRVYSGVAWSSGNVDGAASATDNAIARFDGTSGGLIQNSVVTIDDTTGNMAGVGTLGVGAITTTGALVGTTTQSVFNTVSTALNIGGAATVINLGAATGNFIVANTTLYAKSIVANDNLYVADFSTLNDGALIQGLTAGLGAGAVATNTAFGDSVLSLNVSGANNTGFGNGVLMPNTASGNTGIGSVALRFNTTGGANTSVGYGAIRSNTTASNSTAVGYEAGYYSLGASNTAVGYQAYYGASTTTTGTFNTTIGAGSGSALTSGGKNVILGSYSGNQGSLDIRTASNYVVLSDGDGNPRAYWNGASATFNGQLLLGATSQVANEKFLMYGNYSAFSDGTYTGYIGSSAGVITGGAAADFGIRSNANLVFASGGTTERAIITSGGNLLVGTSSDPGDKIFTSGSIRGVTVKVDGGAYITGPGSDVLAFYAGSAERARIDNSGNLGIGTSSPNASAILDAQSTTKGVRMPNMTTTQKNAIASPAAGLIVFDTTLAKLCVYSGAAWQTITSV